MAKNARCVNQPGLLFAKCIGVEVVIFQKSWALIGKEYISILEKLIEPARDEAIVLVSWSTVMVCPFVS
jgi:hypothetical protein